ncbi:eCIS core domain-containing protein [Streptomyces sp. NBC_01268]|uniref:eCIS core domain-containing protein n=1 Tax=Streptomyces sp. NBC_01268 TaxID=2903806 RepID=UPI003FCE0FC4
MRAKAKGREATSDDRPLGNARTGTTAREPLTATGPARGAVSPANAAALQARIGNAAVARAVRREQEGGGRREQEPSGRRSLVHDVLRRPGRPLGEPLRAEMEERLGADFSDVRVHTGATAQRSAAEIGARAYTSGRDVVIGAGGGDKHTLAHELTHVIQQRGGPVPGTDNGAGLSLSDPSDAFERAAEANATRVMAGPRPRSAPGPAPDAPAAQRATTPGARPDAPVQRMLGFETEISLPVEDARGHMYEGDTDLAKSTKEDFKVVSDKRTLNNRRGYSNIEFVTGAVRVVGSMNEAGNERLDRLVDEIRTVREAFYGADDKTLLAELPLELEVLTEGAEARVAPKLPYPEHSGQPGLGDGLFVHYSVGVPLKGMPLFFDHLRTAAPDAPGAPNRRARFRLTQAKAFAAGVVEMYEGDAGAAKKRKQQPDTDALDGYCQLFFTQVAAVADYVAEEEDRGQIKNLTAVLSRSRLSDVRALLDTEFRGFLNKRADDVLNLLARYQEDSGEGTKLAFKDRATRDVEGGPVSLLAFARSAIKGTPKVFQQRVFGGMNQIDPHEEEGAVMVPFEIRTMGSQMKTWDQLRTELHDLARWAEEAYRHDRGEAGDTSRRRTGPGPDSP